MISVMQFAMNKPCLLLVVSAVLAAAIPTGAVAATGDVSISPSTSTEDIGDTFSREVLVEVGSDVLSNYTFFVNYDPSVVEVSAINGGNTIQFGDFILTDIDNVEGIVRFSQINANPNSPTGIISVANIEFLAVGESSGSSAITLEVSSIGVAPDGNPIQTNVAPAGVTVSPPPVNDADLSITKTASSSSIPVGGQVVYTITITNNGPMTAQNVSIADSVPTEIFVDSISGCTGPLSECAIGDLAPSDSAQVFVTATVIVEGTFTNMVSVQSDATDPVSSNDTATATVTVVPRDIDLSLEKMSPSIIAKRGDTIVFTLKVTNNGNFQADDVTVTDVLPTGLAFISTDGCTEDPNGVSICSLGSLAAGASIQFTVTAQVTPDALGAITNTASVTSTQTDTDPSDNEASFVVTVVRDTYCEARNLIALQLLDLGATAALRAEGLPVSASIALINLQLCDAEVDFKGIPGLALATENAYQINQDIIEGLILGGTDVSGIQESLAILTSISAEIQTAILESISDTFDIDISDPFEIVMGSGGTFMPAMISGSSLQEEYLAFDERSITSRSVSEPYSGSFDLDGDGFTNAEEYEIVVVVGGGSTDDFARAASGLEPSTTRGGGGGGGGGCFIATAAYGSPLAKEIDSLRLFRDAYLVDSAVGTAFIDTYYRTSPPVANAIAKNEALRFAVRMALAPIVLFVNLLMTTTLPLAEMIMALTAAGAVNYFRIRRKATRQVALSSHRTRRF